MIPSGAGSWAQPLDPSDRANYLLQLHNLLVAGEKIASATVVLLPEAIALGLMIIQDAEHGPSIADDTNIEVWCEIAPDARANPAFQSGVGLPIEFTIITDSSPHRRFQRTMVLKVIEQ